MKTHNVVLSSVIHGEAREWLSVEKGLNELIQSETDITVNIRRIPYKSFFKKILIVNLMWNENEKPDNQNLAVLTWEKDGRKIFLMKILGWIMKTNLCHCRSD